MVRKKTAILRPYGHDVKGCAASEDAGPASGKMPLCSHCHTTRLRRFRGESRPKSKDLPASVTILLLQPILSNDMEAVDRVLREALHSDVPLIRQVGEYIIAGGGKRLGQRSFCSPPRRAGTAERTITRWQQWWK